MVMLLRYIQCFLIIKLINSDNNSLIKYNLIGHSNFSNYVLQNEFEQPKHERRFQDNGDRYKLATQKSDHHYSSSNQLLSSPDSILPPNLDESNVFHMHTTSGYGSNRNRLATNGYGYSLRLHDPIFLLATLSFVAYLINTVLGLVNRVHAPTVFHARFQDENELMKSIDRFLGEYYNLNTTI